MLHLLWVGGEPRSIQREEPGQHWGDIGSKCLSRTSQHNIKGPFGSEGILCMVPLMMSLHWPRPKSRPRLILDFNDNARKCYSGPRPRPEQISIGSAHILSVSVSVWVSVSGSVNEPSVWMGHKAKVCGPSASLLFLARFYTSRFPYFPLSTIRE